jgi:hypothetical protein
MIKSKPDGDLGGKENLADQATPKGGGSKATDDPQGNPVSISAKERPNCWVLFANEPTLYSLASYISIESLFYIEYYCMDIRPSFGVFSTCFWRVFQAFRDNYSVRVVTGLRDKKIVGRIGLSLLE